MQINKENVISNFKEGVTTLFAEKGWNLNMILRKWDLSPTVVNKVMDDGDFSRIREKTLMKMQQANLDIHSGHLRKPRKARYGTKKNGEFNTEIPESMMDSIPEQCIEKKVDGEQLKIETPPEVEPDVIPEQPKQDPVMDAEFVVTREHHNREIRSYSLTGTLQDILDELIKEYDSEGWVLKVKITHKDVVE